MATTAAIITVMANCAASAAETAMATAAAFKSGASEDISSEKYNVIFGFLKDNLVVNLTSGRSLEKFRSNIAATFGRISEFGSEFPDTLQQQILKVVSITRADPRDRNLRMFVDQLPQTDDDEQSLGGDELIHYFYRFRNIGHPVLAAMIGYTCP